MQNGSYDGEPPTRQTLVGKFAQVVDSDHSSESCTKGSSPTVIVLPDFVSAASAAESLRSRVRSEVLDTNDLWTVAVAWEHGLTFLTTDKMPCIRESIQEGIKNRSNSPSHRLSETSGDLPES